MYGTVVRTMYCSKYRQNLKQIKNNPQRGSPDARDDTQDSRKKLNISKHMENGQTDDFVVITIPVSFVSITIRWWSETMAMETKFPTASGLNR